MSENSSDEKHKVVFLTNEELSKPSKIVLSEDDDEPRGFLLPNGEINWSCPCLGSMVVGPCNIEFRESLTCFHVSTAEPKGSDCIEKFRELNECMARYPTLYPKDEETEQEDLMQFDLEDSKVLNEQDAVTVAESESDSETSSSSNATNTKHVDKKN